MFSPFSDAILCRRHCYGCNFQVIVTDLRLVIVGVGIRPRAMSDRLLLYPYVTWSVRSNPEAVVIYYILLAVIGTVSSVFAYYPHPGGQA